MYGQAAKKLLFMGGEIAQRAEWNHDASLDWDLLAHESHAGVQRWVRDLNWLYRSEPALHELDCEPEGFEWVDCNDAEQSLLSFLRRGRTTDDVDPRGVQLHPHPAPRLPPRRARGRRWQEVLNSDAEAYWGQGHGNLGGVEAVAVPSHGHPFSVEVTLPPLGVVFFKKAGVPRTVRIERGPDEAPPGEGRRGFGDTTAAEGQGGEDRRTEAAPGERDGGEPARREEEGQEEENRGGRGHPPGRAADVLVDPVDTWGPGAGRRRRRPDPGARGRRTHRRRVLGSRAGRRAA